MRRHSGLWEGTRATCSVEGLIPHGSAGGVCEHLRSSTLAGPRGSTLLVCWSVVPAPALSQEDSLCFHGLRMTPSRTLRVPGVPRLPRQDDAERCSTRVRLQQLHSCSRNSKQLGQGLIEFALVFGFIGIALSSIWLLISSLAAEHGVSPVWWLVHLVYSGWLDWIWSGQVP